MLRNTIALVTGCGSGFGRVTVKRFVDEGARVVGLDRNKEKGSELKELGGDFEFCHADTSDENQVKEVMDHIEKSHGYLDVLVNCAGIGTVFPLFNQNKWTLDKFALADHLLKHNVVGTFNVCRMSIPVFLKKSPDEDGGRGVIINTSGFPATEGSVTQSFMSGTFGAINSMTLPLSRDLASEGIRVVTISPGVFESPMTSYLPHQVKSFLGSFNAFPHRLGDLNEFADHAVAIVENKMLNGVVIRLDGGYRNNF